MSSVAQRLITAEEFLRLPGSKYQELVRGEIVETMPSGAQASIVTATLTMLLHEWAKQGVGGEVGHWSGGRSAHLGCLQCRLDHAGGADRHLVLKIEHVFE